jgi:4-amino-4-deoxy-L-arabinose transferase-like glycosyltransferase
MKKISVRIIFLIVFLGFLLRIVKTNQIPHGFNADEAAIAYNVYSLLKTGRDEHSQPWPLHLESFADHKPSGYPYLSLPFISILGLSKLAVRLPSIIFGVLSIFLIYLLFQELFPKLKKYAFLGALLLAISPWHIHFSRGAWETNVATAFLLLGSWLFLRASRQSRFSLLLASLLSFILSTYIYHSHRVIAPGLLLFLVISKRQEFFKFKKKIGLFLLVGVVLSLPLVFSFLEGNAAARFSGVSITGDVGPLWSANQLRGEHGEAIGAFWVRILHNRPITFAVKISQNWLAHFSPEYLIFEGDRLRRSSPPGIGEFYYLDLLFLVLGFVFAFKNKEKSFFFPAFWLLLAPFPAAITLQSPHSLRSHPMVAPFLIIAAYGLAQAFRNLKKKKLLFKGALVLVGFLYLWQLGFFLNQYFVHYPIRAPEAWEYGMGELVDFLKPIQDQYERIYVTDRYDQPYIIFLFYLKYPPDEFQADHQLTLRDKFNFSTVRDFANFHFEAIDWESLKNEKNVLIIGTDEEIPDSAQIIKRIYFKNQQPAFEIVEL